MQQKVQFLAATLHQPELVILDEPFSGLDPLNTELLQNMMLELRSRNATVIFSTHQMELAQRLCDRIVLINRGRKLIEGSLHDVRSQFSERIVLLDGEGDFAALAALPGVRDVRVTGGQARLELAEQVNPDTLLRAALAHVRLTRFEVQRPDLHQIFVKLVGSDHPAAAAAE
jgi:ABC-2 type transport system ATP-binding protein